MAGRQTGRSWLFVPGDSERKLARAGGAGADAVIVDLEDAVAPERKRVARAMAHEWLAGQSGGNRWVRINAMDTAEWQADLQSVMAGAPTGIMLPKSAAPAQLERLSAELDLLETEQGIAPGSTRILPLVGETPAAALAIPAYATAAIPRLAGLTWGAEDLSIALRATRKHDGAGQWADSFRFVRAQLLLAARALGAMAIDTLHADFRDDASLHTVASASRADGFDGMLAIHSDQVPIINEAFRPSETELAQARAIVAAFAASPGRGAIAFEGRMIDLPHLIQAQRLLG